MHSTATRQKRRAFFRCRRVQALLLCLLPLVGYYALPFCVEKPDITPPPDAAVYDRHGELLGYVAGADGKFVQAASVTVENNTLIVSVPAVTAPVKVRYAWSANPMEVLCLYNTAGLPATPFEMSI